MVTCKFEVLLIRGTRHSRFVIRYRVDSSRPEPLSDRPLHRVGVEMKANATHPGLTSFDR